MSQPCKPAFSRGEDGLDTRESLASSINSSRDLAERRARGARFRELLDLPFIEFTNCPSSPIAGVYLLYHYDTCLYAGQSGNIRYRLGQHEKEKSWYTDVNKVLICPELEDESDRLALETYKILEIIPAFNRSILIQIGRGGRLFPAHWGRSRTKKRS